MFNFSAFTIFEIIPLFIFGVAFLIIFGIFIIGALKMIFFDDPEGGMDTIIKSLVYFLLFLIFFLVFLLVSFLIQRGDIFKQKESDIEFPLPPVGNLPPSPESFEFLGYYFSEPQIISSKDKMLDNAAFVVLCKSETGYDIIDSGLVYESIIVSNQPNYSCWMENCESENIYFSYSKFKKEDTTFEENMINKINKSIKPVCQ